MAASLPEIRVRARQHEEDLAAARWFTPSQLAKRWQISETSVRAIPDDQLRYKPMGQGATLKRRRYREDWVLAYEESSGKVAVDA